MNGQRVLVTGGGGYIGSHLTSILLDRGYRVRVFDAFLFDRHSLDHVQKHPCLEIMVGDIRHMEEMAEALRDVDSVIHLAGIVGDPACSLKEEVTLAINYEATKLLVDLCRYYGARRLIFASTCSVYGARDEELLTEESPIAPLSLYAETKIRSEEILLQAAMDGSLDPVIVRFATIFGLSYRMRFDLVLNILTAKAVWDKEIRIYGGDQWRPLVHARDAGFALLACLEAPQEVVSGRIFNAGSNRENYRIKDLEEIFQRLFPGISVLHLPAVSDERSYNVSFDRIEEVLGFKALKTAETGIQEMARYFQSGQFTDYQAARYYNVKYRYK